MITIASYVKPSINPHSKKLNFLPSSPGITTTPKRVVNRKRKNGGPASSSSAGGTTSSSSAPMEHQGLNIIHPNDHLDPQVSSVSSTDSDYHNPHRRLGNPGNGNGGMNGGGGGMNGGGGHHNPHNGGGGLHGMGGGGGGGMDIESGLDKPVKKKRKRCGECTGCQRKDNCGDCAPCRNDKRSVEWGKI